MALTPEQENQLYSLGAGTIGNLVNAWLGSDAAKSAAGISRAGAETAKANLDPYAKVGKNAVTSWYDKISAGPGDFKASPDYDWRVKQGVNAIEQTAAARGKGLSGQTMKAASDYSQKSASDEFGNWYSRWLQGLTPYKEAATLGMNAATTQSLYDFKAGEAEAAGKLGSTKSWTDFLDWAIRNGLDAKTINDLSKYFKQNPVNDSPIGDRDADYDSPIGDRDADYDSPIGDRDADYDSPLVRDTGSDYEPPPVRDIFDADNVSDVLEGTGNISLEALSGVIPPAAYAYYSSMGLSTITPAMYEAAMSGVTFTLDTGLAGLLPETGAVVAGGAATGGIGAAALAGGYMLAAWYAMTKVAEQIDKWVNGPWEDDEGRSPFAEGTLKGVMFGGSQPGVVQTDFDAMADSFAPDVEMLKKRFKTQFPNDKLPPAGATNKELAPFWSWVMKQPETQEGMKNFYRQLYDNYEWTASSHEGEASGYVKNNGTSYSDQEVSYAAKGAIINEPMVAFGQSGKKIVMGEAGPEVIVPKRRFDQLTSAQMTPQIQERPRSGAGNRFSSYKDNRDRAYSYNFQSPASMAFTENTMILNHPEDADRVTSMFPSSKIMGARYKTDTGTDAPISNQPMLKGESGRYQEWLVKQPEYRAARDYMSEWQTANFELTGNPETGFTWQPRKR